jgi:hypothetical protein
MRPYNDIQLNRSTLLREFNTRIDDIEYVWHRDEDDRMIEVFSGAGWQLQLDNQLPVLLESGCEYHIPAGIWHRLHKGQDNLTILIFEGKKKKKKADGMRSVRKGADKNPKVTRMDFLPDDVLDDIAKEKNEGKKKKKTDFDIGGQDQYRAKRSQKQIDKQADLTRKYNAAKTEKQRQKYRDMIDRSREKEGVNETLTLSRYQLNELISETVEAEKLALMLEKIEELEEKKKRKKSGKSKKGLSKAVKKSLDKKADRRCLTRGSVYAEFRKGLAAYYSSGSRKGMSAHQWAHARVNSAQPSKSWASVKKRKKCPKKKKK